MRNGFVHLGRTLSSLLQSVAGNFSRSAEPLSCWSRHCLRQHGLHILVFLSPSLAYSADGFGNEIVNNLHFPGHYYDEESGLYYNWNRYYNPQTGRYITSDPIGLQGGPNTYLYANANPMRFVDPLGLVVQGRWIESPRFNINGAGIDNWRFISPSVSKWGYLHIARLYGHAKGYVNIDVDCADDCINWEIHDQVPIHARGSFDVGPNLLALGAGYGAGPFLGVLANIAIVGAAALQAEHHYLSLAEQSAGTIIKSILADGPTAMCLGSKRP